MINSVLSIVLVNFLSATPAHAYNVRGFSPRYCQFISIFFPLTGWRKNSDAVLQIVELCLKLDIALSDTENKKFLNLMLRRPSMPADKQKKKKSITIEKYQFKF